MKAPPRGGSRTQQRWHGLPPPSSLCCQPPHPAPPHCLVVATRFWGHWILLLGPGFPRKGGWVLTWEAATSSHALRPDSGYLLLPFLLLHQFLPSSCCYPRGRKDFRPSLDLVRLFVEAAFPWPGPITTVSDGATATSFRLAPCDATIGKCHISQAS